jgi:single-strand DNA-binding protein
LTLPFFFPVFLLKNTISEGDGDNIINHLKITVMELVGRITKDAQVHQTKNGKDVVNFSIAINDNYKPKESEVVRLTTFVNCSYWVRTGIAPYLKKGTLVEITGRLGVNAYLDNNNQPKASLNFHVNAVKIHSSRKAAEAVTAGAPSPESKEEDLPF